MPGFGPPPVDQQKIISQLVSQGVPIDQATQMAQQMANSINGVSQSPENKIINTALPVAGAVVGGSALAGSLGGAGGASGTGGAGDVIGGLLDAAKGGAGAILSFLQGHGSDLLQAAGIADAAYRETQANKYGTDALKQAQSAYDAKAPLRALGIAGLTNAGQGNPFATRTAAPLPVAGPAGPGPSPTDVLNQTGANTTSGGPRIPRQGPVPAPITPPNFNPSVPMRIAGM
jgi:hypothetical protein